MNGLQNLIHEASLYHDDLQMQLERGEVPEEKQEKYRRKIQDLYNYIQDCESHLADLKY